MGVVANIVHLFFAHIVLVKQIQYSKQPGWYLYDIIQLNAAKRIVHNVSKYYCGNST